MSEELDLEFVRTNVARGRIGFTQACLLIEECERLRREVQALGGGAREPWTPFERAEAKQEQIDAQLANTEYIAQLAGDFGVSVEIVRATLGAVSEDDVWLNSRYQVNVRRYPEISGGTGLIHLSIKRRDKQPLGAERYRDFMRIKDELVGPEYEGVELYPARSREIDTATQYHLWLLDDPKFRFPFGWSEGRRVLAGSALDSTAGVTQNPFEEHHVR